MREQFVVFVQSLEDTHRVEVVYGPFFSYGTAAKFVQLYGKDAVERKLWYGIRQLISGFKHQTL